MKLETLAIALLATVLAVPAYGQTDTPDADPPALEGDDATVSATGEGGRTADIGNLLANVEDLANGLNDELTQLEERIQVSRESLTAADEALNEALSAVSELNERLAENGAIWSELNALLDQWEDERANASEMAVDDERYQALADDWRDRIANAVEARDEISLRRAEALSLAASIEADRDLVAAYIRAGDAEAVLESLNSVRDQISAMTDGLRQVVVSVGAAGGPETVTTE